MEQTIKRTETRYEVSLGEDSRCADWVDVSDVFDPSFYDFDQWVKENHYRWGRIVYVVDGSPDSTL